MLPCCLGRCDCPECKRLKSSFLQKDLERELAETGIKPENEMNRDRVVVACAIAQLKRITACFDFQLPDNFLRFRMSPIPQIKASSRIQTRAITKIPKRGFTGIRFAFSADKKKSSEKLLLTEMSKPQQYSADSTESLQHTVDTSRVEKQDKYAIFRPTCAKIDEIYDASLKSVHSAKLASVTSVARFSAHKRPEIKRNKRDSNELRTQLITEQKNEKEIANSTSRAARANQRRLAKATSAYVQFNTLSSREAQLRFDRSSIHAWGVFADTDIGPDELIVEYRGELISNATAERREKEYEYASIGSDYMFRIDAETVCDATKQGNVARFINASCDANCTTKIITTDGTNRIAIYSSKPIQTGDELSYDYKFPVEANPTKRLRCFCGAKECRGYMN